MKKYNSAVFYGDSITKGTYTKDGDPMPMRIADPCYCDIVAKKLGVKNYENFGINGVSYSNASNVMTEEAFCNRVDDCKTADVIFVAFGTNDYGTDVPIGQTGDNTTLTFFGAVDYCLKTLKARAPLSDIYVLLPLPRLDENKPNKSGFTLDDYRNAITKVGKKYGVTVIDGKKLPVNPSDENDKQNIIFDGTHFNDCGHKLIADLILEYIK